jgi:hypothetical protein
MAASGVGLIMLVPAAGASSSSISASAVTVITNRPDGGNHDSGTPGTNQTWANDNFTRTATVTPHGQVAASNCGGVSPCYYWTGHISDAKGKFTTNPTSTSNSYSPGAGTGGTGATGPFPIGVSATGKMSGHANYAFFSDQSVTSATPPGAENDNGNLPSGDKTTGLWVEQFFTSGNFWDTSGTENPGSLITTWSWSYELKFGADNQCSNVASKWTDASFNNAGDDPVDGNVLAPDSAHC